MFNLKKKTLADIDKYDSIIDKINEKMNKNKPGCSDKLHLDEKINTIQADDEKDYDTN